MALSLIKKTFVNVYIDTGEAVHCHLLGEVNPDTFDATKIPAITTALQNCLQSTAQIIAVKKVEGYVFDYPFERIKRKTHDTSVILHTPYIFDFNCGWIGVGDGVWTYEYPTQCYSDIYEVRAGIEYRLALGETVGTRFRVIFSTTDVSTVTSSGKVQGVAVNSFKGSPSAYEEVTYTPASDGYLIVQKDNAGTTGIVTYLYGQSSFNSNKVIREISLREVAELRITAPTKTSYRAGETYDWTDARVLAVYDDGTREYITENAVFNPASGTTVTSSNAAVSTTIPVTVSYEGISDSFDVTVYGVALMSLDITPPTKTLYRKGETVDYTGCVVTAVYGDGSRQDVTNNATFSVADGTTINSDTSVSVTYTDGEDTVTGSFNLLVTYLERINVTKPTKMTYSMGDTLDYTGLQVIAVYKNASNEDVTSLCVITPAEGTVITDDITETLYQYGIAHHELNVSISFTDSSGTKKTSSFTLSIPSNISLTFPNKTAYHVGETLDYTGFKLEDNGVDISSSVIFESEEGTVIPSSWCVTYNSIYQFYGYDIHTIHFSYTDTAGNQDTAFFNIKVYE